MNQIRRITAIIESEDDGLVALCTELDIASQGNSIEETWANLNEALSLFFEAPTLPKCPVGYIPTSSLRRVDVPIG